ncbi:MAG: hypothetical protein WC869_16965 [Phycisphaerae bacterium]|jgi:hypothetical protein
MACCGISVLEYERIQFAQAVSEIEQVLQDHGITELEAGRQLTTRNYIKTLEGDVVKLSFCIGGVQVIAKVKKSSTGCKVTMISQNGTFEMGKAQFEKYIVQGLAARGIDINPTIETHSHQHQQAYQQAYSNFERN